MCGFVPCVDSMRQIWIEVSVPTTAAAAAEPMAHGPEQCTAACTVRHFGSRLELCTCEAPTSLLLMDHAAATPPDAVYARLAGGAQWPRRQSLNGVAVPAEYVGGPWVGVCVAGVRIVPM